MAELTETSPLLKKVSASSILEVTVGLVILSVSFSAFLILYLNVASGSRFLQKMKFEARLALEYKEIVRDREYFDVAIEEGTVKIIRTVTSYQQSPQLKDIYIRAVSSDGKVLAELRSLVYVND